MCRPKVKTAAKPKFIAVVVILSLDDEEASWVEDELKSDDGDEDDRADEVPSLRLVDRFGDAIEDGDRTPAGVGDESEKFL